MHNITDALDGLVAEKQDAFFALSNRVWDTPETNYLQYQSVAAHVTMLTQQGFRVQTGVAGLPTAVMGEAGAGAMLAATAVKDYLAAQGIAGRIRYYGCPAEEGGSSKGFMVRSGVFDDVDIAASFGRFGLPVRKSVPLCDVIFPPESGDGTLVGSTDVGTVSWVVPTVQLRSATYAIGTPGHSWQLVAQGKLPAAHKGMAHAAKAMAATAVDLLRDPALIAQAKEDFAARLADRPFISPIPDDVNPPLLETSDASLQSNAG